MAQNAPLWISKEKVYQLVDQRELLVTLEKGLSVLNEEGLHEIQQPKLSSIPLDNQKGFMLNMPCYSQKDDILSTKILTYFPKNKERPTHQAWVLSLDPHDGHLNAIIDGESITAIRTALVSAISTKYLAKDNCNILTLVGSGVQARSHYYAMKIIRNFKEVRVWSRSKENGEKLSREIGAQYFQNLEEAVMDADVICTVTFATSPIIHKKWIKKGAHINAVGACRHDWLELDPKLMKNSAVFCDNKEFCKLFSGDIIHSGCEIKGNIADVIRGNGTKYKEEITIFKSVGMAIEDAITSKFIFDSYMKQLNN